MLVFFVWPKAALAQSVLGALSDPVDAVYDFILAILGTVVDFIGSILITVTASILNYVFSFQSFATVPVVQIGWTISRDLANMAFILVMLLIAFGTILQIETYGWKKLIPKLIIAALLINFSLIICAAIIDVGNSIALFFISGGQSGTEVDIGASILSSLRAGAIAQLRNNSSFESPVTSLIMATIGQLIMYVVISFLLLAFAGVMISRLIKLWLLIIFSPFAWVSAAMPGKFGGYFGKWWSEFINLALVFPIAISFFLTLGIVAGATFNSIEIKTTQNGGEGIGGITSAGGVWEALFPSTTFSVIMQFILVVGILWAGLEQAQKTGLAGGKLVVGWAESTRKWAEGKAIGAGKAASGYAFGKARTAASGLAQRGLLKEDKGERTKLRDSLVSGMQLPVIGGLFGKALKAPLALAEQRKKQIEDLEKKLDSQSNQMLELDWKAADLNKRTAIANIFNKRNYLNRTKDFIKDDLGDVMKLSVSLGTGKELMMAAPNIAIENNIINNDKTQTLDKINDLFEKMKPEEVKKVSDESLEKMGRILNPAEYTQFMETVLKNWSGKHVGNLTEPPQPKNQKAIEDYIKDPANGFGTTEADRINTIRTRLNNGRLANYLESSPGAKDIIDIR